jgi:hypothetical protein
MQLVLGARVEGNLETSGAPLPAPPDRWRLGERGRRALRALGFALAFAALALLGALHGASVAIGAEGALALASASPAPIASPAARREREVRGAFWRPPLSTAERPPAELAPRRWDPRGN